MHQQPLAIHLHINSKTSMYATPPSPIWFGTSGLVLPVPNKQHFPREFQSASRLTYYSSLFNSIEVNSSFYKVPQPGTFAKWGREVPDDFRFTVKLWRGITHIPDLAFIPIDVNKFMHAADHLFAKKGCLLIQFPPSLKAHRLPQLQRLLERLLQSDPQHTWKIAVEFRNRTWYKKEVEDVLDSFHATRVLHDMPDSKTLEPSNSPFTYLRFHGPAGDYKGGYGEKALQPYAERIRRWHEEGKQIFVYFNNTAGEAIADLNTLRTLSGVHPTPAPTDQRVNPSTGNHPTTAPTDQRVNPSTGNHPADASPEPRITVDVHK